MFVTRILTGTLVFAILAFGCNSGEEPEVDPAEQQLIELEDVRNDTIDQDNADIEELTPVEPDTPGLNTPNDHGGETAHDAGRRLAEQGQNAVVSEPGDAPANATEQRDRNQNNEKDRPVVTIPPEVINPQYKPLLNENNELVVSGRSVDELLELIGEPMSMIRQGQRGSGWHKEVWVLPIYQEDSTGLYIYIQNGKVADWRLDTFVGIGNHPQLLEWF
jgi:hypothetical protein